MGHNCNIKHADYNSPNIYTWCTNCGNYGIHGAMKRALVNECIAPRDTLLCFDIGCNGNGADKIEGYSAHGLHGRVIPFAAGAALANRKITVIASGGDGATLGEGINHLIHAVRANYNMTFLLHNNSNYGLTTGQASPTTKKGVSMNSSPDGVYGEPLNVASMILSLKPTFVARAYSGNVKQLTELIQLGIRHKGFSFIEILQDCPTYNKSTPHSWYLERVYPVERIPAYDSTNIIAAMGVSADLEYRIATGLLYQDKTRPDFYSQLQNRVAVNTELIEEVKQADIRLLLEKFA